MQPDNIVRVCKASEGDIHEPGIPSLMPYVTVTADGAAAETS